MGLEADILRNEAKAAMWRRIYLLPDWEISDDESIDPIDVIQFNDVYENLKECMDKLDARDRDILEKRFGLNAYSAPAERSCVAELRAVAVGMGALERLSKLVRTERDQDCRKLASVEIAGMNCAAGIGRPSGDPTVVSVFS